jgi:dTMP kinase
MRGKFITFEGGEGSGKSTQASLLANHLRQAGLSVIETREPGGSPFAERVRALILDPATPPHGALSEALLFTAARADHLAATIRPALAAGSWVVCDRFTDSTRVYQGTAGGLPADVLDALEALVVAETRPDLTFLLDLAPTVGLLRAHARRGAAISTAPRGAAGQMQADAPDSYEARDLAYHERLRAGFLALAESAPQRIVVIDGGASAEAIAAEILAAVVQRLGAAL